MPDKKILRELGKESIKKDLQERISEQPDKKSMAEAYQTRVGIESAPQAKPATIETKAGPKKLRRELSKESRFELQIRQILQEDLVDFFKKMSPAVQAQVRALGLSIIAQIKTLLKEEEEEEK